MSRRGPVSRARARLACRLFGHATPRYRTKGRRLRPRPEFPPTEKYCPRCGAVLLTIRNMFKP